MDGYPMKSGASLQVLIRRSGLFARVLISELITESVQNRISFLSSVQIFLDDCLIMIKR